MPPRMESDYTMSDQSELKNMGLKATFPRLKILDIFRKSDSATSARKMSIAR